jgi:hypothetical protein
MEHENTLQILACAMHLAMIIWHKTVSGSVELRHPALRQIISLTYVESRGRWHWFSQVAIGSRAVLPYNDTGPLNMAGIRQLGDFPLPTNESLRNVEAIL